MALKKAFDKAMLVAELALDKKGENIVLLDMRSVSTIFDWFVLVSAPSSTRIKAISTHIVKELTRKKFHVLHQEGRINDPNWILLDFEDVVVHVFHENIRDHYGLERLWADAPRKLMKQKCKTGISSKK